MHSLLFPLASATSPATASPGAPRDGVADDLMADMAGGHDAEAGAQQSFAEVFAPPAPAVSPDLADAEGEAVPASAPPAPPTDTPEATAPEGAPPDAAPIATPSTKPDLKDRAPRAATEAPTLDPGRPGSEPLTFAAIAPRSLTGAAPKNVPPATEAAPRSAPTLPRAPAASLPNLDSSPADRSAPAAAQGRNVRFGAASVQSAVLTRARPAPGASAQTATLPSSASGPAPASTAAPAAAVTPTSDTTAQTAEPRRPAAHDVTTAPLARVHRPEARPASSVDPRPSAAAPTAPPMPRPFDAAEASPKADPAERHRAGPAPAVPAPTEAATSTLPADLPRASQAPATTERPKHPTPAPPVAAVPVTDAAPRIRLLPSKPAPRAAFAAPTAPVPEASTRMQDTTRVPQPGQSPALPAAPTALPAPASAPHLSGATPPLAPAPESSHSPAPMPLTTATQDAQPQAPARTHPIDGHRAPLPPAPAPARPLPPTATRADPNAAPAAAVATALTPPSTHPAQPATAFAFRHLTPPVSDDTPRPRQGRTAEPDAPLPEVAPLRAHQPRTAPLPPLQGLPPAGPIPPGHTPFAEKAAADHDPFPVDDIATLARTDAAGSAPAPTGPSGRADLAPQIARQMADALAAQPRRPVEITLSPEELGRLRMTLSTSDSGIVLQVAAERPETLDLMRRHIDALQEELREIGFGDVRFDFQGGDADSADNQRDDPSATGGDRDDDHRSASSPEIADLPTRPAPAPQRVGDSGVDVRL